MVWARLLRCTEVDAINAFSLKGAVALTFHWVSIAIKLQREMCSRHFLSGLQAYYESVVLSLFVLHTVFSFLHYLMSNVKYDNSTCRGRYRNAY